MNLRFEGWHRIDLEKPRQNAAMCTAIILRRPNEFWPVIFAANRDEMRDRPWVPPGRHWPDRPEVVAGLDESAGGSWLGLNDHGVLAAVLNRRGSLGPQPGKRSRGELVLEALDHADAAEAAHQLQHLDPLAYRAFNLIVADNSDAFWLRNTERRHHPVEVISIPDGLSMLTAADLNDPGSPRIARHLPDLRAALPPDPDLDDWDAWQEILGRGPDRQAEDAMCLRLAGGFETVSSSLIALPGPGQSRGGEAEEPQWLFAAGGPDHFPFEPVQL